MSEARAQPERTLSRRESIRNSLIGDPEKYNYAALCRPTVPWSKKKQQLKFYEKDEELPIFLALVMGLQHAFAMVGGLITPPFVIFKFSINFIDTASQQYAISAALITSGICSIINCSKIPVPWSSKWAGRQLYIGAGVLSVMGTSFTFLPIFEASIQQMKADGVDPYDAYGRMLGTSMVCSLFELFLSCLPTAVLTTLFPPLVASITVILIGVALTGTGMKYWGGGVVCADMIWKMHSQAEAADVFGLPSPYCANGEVIQGYGSAQFIGLGFTVMVALVFIELFGSTFMKNCNVILALLFGYLIAGVTDNDGYNYVETSKIKDADWITFLWTEWFGLGFYGPAVIPLLIAYLVTTVETVGDISAVYEVSELDTTGPEYKESLQGGLFSDSFCSIFAGLATSMPNTTFSQNNGVIALTKCAARRAGYACGIWLIILGIFGKFAGIITSIPDCVLGGMTIFLFANVLASGIALAGSLDLHSRRVKFIMALSLAIGVGVTVWPFAFADQRASPYTANFWPCDDCSDAMKGFRNGLMIFLSTGYCIGTVVAMTLNFILPADGEIIKNSDMVDPTNKVLEEESSEDGVVKPPQDESEPFEAYKEEEEDEEVTA